MPFDVRFALNTLWFALGVCWAVMAFTAKRTVRKQSTGARWFHVVMVMLAFGLMFSESLRIGPLAARVIPDSATIAIVGVVVTAAGVALAAWARIYLGGNWSGEVTIKQDHQLIRQGPYAWVRHPIYSGALLAMFGTALAIGELRGFLGFALALIAWKIKSLQEEEFLAAQFGPQYAKYRQEVRALIPFVL
jgi:protein-S-isoprenylcysteine O-methyltransferase Ste14